MPVIYQEHCLDFEEAVREVGILDSMCATESKVKPHNPTLVGLKAQSDGVICVSSVRIALNG